MSIRGIFTALVYREVAWLKRFIGDYVTIWLLPSIYGLGIVFLPTLMSDIDFVLQRFSNLFNHPIGLTDALVLSLSLSAILTVVAVTVGDVVQTLYAEFKVYGSFTIILETVSVSAYVLATFVSRALLRSFVNVSFWALSTSYLDKVEFERWLRSALRTLESAKRDLEFGDYNWACFKAHQVASTTCQRDNYWQRVSRLATSSLSLLGAGNRLEKRHVSSGSANVLSE
jgi:hypothetical protein